MVTRKCANPDYRFPFHDDAFLMSRNIVMTLSLNVLQPHAPSVRRVRSKFESSTCLFFFFLPFFTDSFLPFDNLSDDVSAGRVRKRKTKKKFFFFVTVEQLSTTVNAYLTIKRYRDGPSAMNHDPGLMSALQMDLTSYKVKRDVFFVYNKGCFKQEGAKKVLSLRSSLSSEDSKDFS